MDPFKHSYQLISHNEVRDTTASWLSDICNDVCVEPTHQHIARATAIADESACLDIAANGFGEADLREVFRYLSLLPTNKQQSISATYSTHECIKKNVPTSNMFEKLNVDHLYL